MPEYDYTRLSRDEIASFATSPAAVAAFEDLQTAAYDDSPAAVQEVQDAADLAISIASDAQPGDPSLTALAGLSAAVGLLEQTGPDTFTKRAVGVAGVDSIPARGDADARYVRQDQTPAWADPTGTAARTTFVAYAAPVISAVPTQAEVQGVADAVQALSQRVAALVLDLRANGTLT